MKAHFDVIVIGVGSMGSSACWFLARSGLDVLGLEQFDTVHERGSHGGQSRIIRKAYFEHADYVPLLQRAYDNWAVLEKECGEKIYYETGIVYFGRPDNEAMVGVSTSSALFDIPVSELSFADRNRLFPEFRIPNSFQTLLEPEAGFLLPDRAIRAFTCQAERNGATIHRNEQAISWRKTADGVEVETKSHRYSASKLIITSGSWTARLVPLLRDELTVTRQLIAWVKPRDIEKFYVDRFRCWFIEDPVHGLFYGFPALPGDRFGGPAGLKIAHHRPGEPWDPDRVVTEPSPEAVDMLRYALRTYLPDAGDNFVAFKHCLYTYSPDDHFIIDHVPGYDGRVTIACGFSGHGFKFAAVVGEILRDLAMHGRTDLPTGFLRLDRFEALKNEKAAKG